ncbi:YiiX/YebB-like N1pC/P60 family cysteine hydrolase [Gottfriedia sp. S16(2024)]|uniref:YiiX/YebB-like N1pC/P60 family cysteine hydrolase n=1 Tax=Gottfriedia sp. S16(2024) TaxID=3162883 RepID=UPI003D2635F2
MKKLLVEEKIIIGFILCIVCLGILLPKGKANSFQFKPGDILISKSTAPGVSGKGIVGHAGIVIDSKTVLHIAGPNKMPSKISITEWLSQSKNPSTKVIRSKNATLGTKVAQKAKDNFLNKNIPYDLNFTPNPTNIKKTYCSELVWYSYYKAGFEYKKPSTLSMGGGVFKTVWQRPSIIKPYDFLNNLALSYNNFHIVKTFNW